MSIALRIVSNLPLPLSRKLACQRHLLNKQHAKSMSAALSGFDGKAIETLREEHRWEMDLLDEEEDDYITQCLLKEARTLRVSIPSRYDENGEESKNWYMGRMGWHLSDEGETLLRERIRQERKEQNEERSHLVIWLSAIAGLIGAVTGLAAILLGK